MIVYCDTSALIKLYIAEAHSELVAAAIDRAEAVATSRIAWAEFHAAVARRAREVPGDNDAMDKVRDLLSAEWGRYLVIEVSQKIVERAGHSPTLLHCVVMTQCIWLAPPKRRNKAAMTSISPASTSA